ncbi:MAG: DUF2993 domain-containing protein [Aulosira sp. DedQUE10]|nr:DUF2993 domain-containing protein [Aulosira sp. DedQUE10]
MPDNERLEEHILSQAAENTLSNQLDEVEQIDVDVRTDLLKIVQGQVDEVSLTGQGLVFQKDIRVQEIKVKTDSVAVNPLSAIFGQIELNEPVNAIARIVMTVADINHALSSDLIRSQSQKWDLNVDGEIVNFNLQKIQVSLPGSGKIEFRGTVLLNEMGNSRLLDFTARINPFMHSQPLLLESFNCTQGDGLSVNLMAALMQKVKEMMQLPYFEWQKMVLSIKDMKVNTDNIIMLVKAHLQEIPSTDTMLSPQ